MTISYTRKDPPKKRRASKYTDLVHDAVLEPDRWFLIEGTTYNGLHNACIPSGAISRILLEEYDDKFRPELTSREEQTELYFRVVPR